LKTGIAKRLLPPPPPNCHTDRHSRPALWQRETPKADRANELLTNQQPDRAENCYGEATTDHMVRVAGYVRVSTTRQAEKGLSLREQRRRIEAYVVEREWILIRIYEEAGVSGRKARRPALERMLSDCNEFDLLVVPKLDRLGRSATGVYATLRELNDAGIGLISLEPLLDTTTREGRFLLNALVGVAEMEGDLIAERVRETAEARVARGRDWGSRRPRYGFRRGDEGVLVIVPEHAVVVRRAFAEFVAGKPQREIERGFIADGIRGSAGALWRPGTLSKLLRAVEYIGKVRGPSGEIYEGLHEAIVDEETFNRAQELLVANRRSGVRRRTVTGHLLRGRLAKCAHCGRGLQARTEKGLGRYVCDSRKNWGADACPMPVIQQELLDRAVLEYFRSAVLDLETTKAGVERALKARVEEFTTLRAHAENESARAQDRLLRTRRHYQDGRLEPEDWTEQRAQLTAELEAANAEVKRLTKKEGEAAEEARALEFQGNLISAVHDLRVTILESVREASGMDAVRAVLVRIFERFVVGRADLPWLEEPRAPHSVVVGRGFIVVPVPRPEFVVTELSSVSMPDGSTVAVELPGVERSPLSVADFASFTSQKTSLRPRRRTMSSSLRPARAFAANTR
jgi:DNA invertase Pin-like site-specific DNA recombinase